MGRGGGAGGGPGVRRNGGGAGGGPGPGAGQAAIESGRAGGRRAQSQRERLQAGTGAPRQSWARQVGLACDAAVTANLFSPDPTSRGPAGPRVLEHPSRCVQTALSGSSGKREDRPGHPAFLPKRTHALHRASQFLLLQRPLVLLSVCASVFVSASQVRLPSQIFLVLPLSWTPRFCPVPCLSFHQGLPWVSAPSVLVFLLFACLSCFFGVLTGP